MYVSHHRFLFKLKNISKFMEIVPIYNVKTREEFDLLEGAYKKFSEVYKLESNSGMVKVSKGLTGKNFVNITPFDKNSQIIMISKISNKLEGIFIQEKLGKFTRILLGGTDYSIYHKPKD